MFGNGADYIREENNQDEDAANVFDTRWIMQIKTQPHRNHQHVNKV